MKALWLDLGRMRYQPAFDLQARLFEARLKGRLGPIFIQQECPPTFTVGRSGSLANILVPEQALVQAGVEVVEVNRGGDVTYHGPGQFILSPLLYLGDIGINANQYLHFLEDCILEVLQTYGIQAQKKADYPGVYWREAKIASVGIAVKHGYTFHGLSLNVCLDLTPFGWINPCGVVQMPVTSIEAVLGQTADMEQAAVRTQAIFAKALQLEFEMVWLEDVQDLLSNRATE